jgi:hypothetical protein
MMPYYPRLISLVRVARYLVNVAGELSLSPAEAQMLRACDFVTAVAGVWKIPPLPPDLVRTNARPTHLADGWAQLRPTPPAPSLTPPTAPNISRYRRAPLSLRLLTWLVHSLTMDQRHVLCSLFGCQADRLGKRHLQQRLHRVPAARLNRALARLVAAGLVARDRGWLTVQRRCATPSAKPVSLLAAQSIHVLRRGQRQRTHTRGPAPTSPFVLRRASRLPARHLGVGPRPPIVAPVGTSAWGRSMLAKEGG